MADTIKVENGIKVMNDFINKYCNEKYLRFSLCRLFTKNLLSYLINDDQIGMNKRLNELVVIDNSYCDESDYKFITNLFEEYKNENYAEIANICSNNMSNKRLDKFGLELIRIL